MKKKRPSLDVPLPSSDSRPTKQARKFLHSKSTLSRGPPREGVSRAKKRLRAINRLLQQEQNSSNIPDNARQDFEREVSALTSTISDRECSAHRSQMISKYHMIRFFERRKAERVLKRLQKQQQKTQEDDETAKELQRDIHTAEIDLCYTQYHPHLEPYTSLYSGNNKGSKARKGYDGKEEKGSAKSTKKEWGEPTSALQHLHAPRPPVWHEIEAAMVEGQRALERIRERKAHTATCDVRKVGKGYGEQISTHEKKKLPSQEGQSAREKGKEAGIRERERRKYDRGYREQTWSQSKNHPPRYVDENDDQYSRHQQQDGSDGGFFEES